MSYSVQNYSLLKKQFLVTTLFDLWIFNETTNAEAEAQILWPPDVKKWFIEKDPDAGKGWRQKKGTTEDEMVGWDHQLDGHEFQQAPGVGDGQGSLACWSPWCRKELDMTERLNWTEQCDEISRVLLHPTSSHWAVSHPFIQGISSISI